MNNRIRVGIFFGGPSREREISFAGGRTVYDNLNKVIFEPIPIFIDSLGNFILLEWRFLYQGSIRDFYPPNEFIPASNFQIYIESLEQCNEEWLLKMISRVGKLIFPHQFKDLFDIAFLALHGPYGEDGKIQGLLEWYHIPYTGSGILGSSLGIDKLHQKKIMDNAGFDVVPYYVLSKHSWRQTKQKKEILHKIVDLLGLPLVLKTPKQGSSIGVNILHQQDLSLFIKAVNGCFFIEEVYGHDWNRMREYAKQQWLAKLIDLRSGIGLPVRILDRIIVHPDKLLLHLNEYLLQYPDARLELSSLQEEEYILIEQFVTGKEFSCVVLQEAGAYPIALPPTEMIKGDIHFDYRAKYLPGIVRKETPMRVSIDILHHIQKACVKLYELLGCQVYARIDGIFTNEQKIYLNDPNTTAGMNPSSFLFHQAAEIGLNPSQLLTFIIRNSLVERMKSYPSSHQLAKWLATIDQYLKKPLTNSKHT